MYLSPAVRTLRDDPTPGVEATLLVRVEPDGDPDAVAAVVRERGGTVERRTRFDNLHVTVVEPAVADLLAALSEDVAAVETVTSELSGDAGEDLDPGVDG